MDISIRKTSDQASKVSQQDNDSHRLPCRGCTRDCSNYSRCNGTPWRLALHNASDPQHLTQTG